MASLPTLTNMSPTHLCVLTQVLSRDYKNLCLENAKLRAKNKWYHDKFHNSLCDIKTEREINRRRQDDIKRHTREISNLRDTQRRLYFALREERDAFEDARSRCDELREVAKGAMNALQDAVSKPAEFKETLKKYGIMMKPIGSDGRSVDISLDRTARDDEAVPVD